MNLISFLKALRKKLSLVEENSEPTSKYDIPERIPYHLIAKKLVEAMQNNSDEIGKKIIVPNVYYLFFNKDNFK